MRLSEDGLRGRTVIAADGQAVGETVGLELDSADWRVTALRIKLRSGIADRVGAARTLFSAGTVAIPVDLVQSVGDAVVLAIPVEGLRPLISAALEAASAH
jgi:sporulation protein YlmC with PRC-barrel domain